MIAERVSDTSSDTVTSLPVDRPFLRRIIVRTGERVVVVPVADIDWIESADNYVVLHCGRTTHVVRQTLGGLEERLAPAGFVRLSRHLLVNAHRVRELISEPPRYFVLLASGERLPLSRGIREVLARLEVA